MSRSNKNQSKVIKSNIPSRCIKIIRNKKRAINSTGYKKGNRQTPTWTSAATKHGRSKVLHLPSSVSCHTMPSRFTLVPGSQGPKHSGSVARATSDVLTATDRVRTMICSHGEAISLLPTVARRWRGGGAGVETGDSICDGGREGERERKKEERT